MDSNSDLGEAKFIFIVRDYEYYRGDLPEKINLTLSGINRAVVEADIDKVKRCIELGESINKKESQYGYTPLHLAVMGMTDTFQNGDSSWLFFDDPYASEKMFEFVLAQKGVELDATCLAGWTPLYLATSFDYVTVADTLIEAGADVNASDNESDRPLHLAVRYESMMYHLLLKHGAVIHKDDKWKNTFSMAQLGHRREAEEMLRQYEEDLNASDDLEYSKYGNISLTKP